MSDVKRYRMALHDMQGRVEGSKLSMFAQAIDEIDALQARVAELEKSRMVLIGDKINLRSELAYVQFRADLPPTDAEVMAHPKVKALIRAALEAAAGFVESHEVGIDTRKGYIVTPSMIEGTQCRHVGMAYAASIRALADDPEAIAQIIKATEGRG